VSLNQRELSSTLVHQALFLRPRHANLSGVRFCRLTILATFDTTKPANTWFRVTILSAIQPAPVYGTFHGVYAGLFYGISVIGDSNEHEISVGGVIPNATP